MAALAEVRRAGHATTVDQLDYGITAIAVPVRGADGRVVAALNSSGYTGRVTPESLRSERLATLRAVAAKVEAAIARTPTLQAALGG
jgi:IclR family pca regulon transcriptional regulator